jgi:hypothetical protein
MSLLNNNKKKDNKKGQPKSQQAFPGQKGKANSKAVNKQTKLPGSAQRGS